MKTSRKTEQPRRRGIVPPADPRDRLIIALYAQLKTERETRKTLEWAIRHGALSADVLSAIAGDPVPVVTGDDAAAVEKIVALDERRRGRGPTGNGLKRSNDDLSDL